MKYLISRLSARGEDEVPCEGATKKLLTSSRRGFSNYKSTVWVIESESVDELFEKFGDLIITGSGYDEYPIEVQIYDDYVE